ncbi:MAG: site-specific DNA-methyltransferase [Prevotellaceae bacterium]|jgi:adenine-specific DNA-methyltransferase|nr:site-specific DNA-methyltransferase [Prevotellaceae bacterium]
MNEQNQGGGLAAAIKYNEEVKPNTELLVQLKANFPQYFDRYGNFKADKFEAELKANNVSESRDGYRLNFVGKDYARLQTGLASETTLVPDCLHNAKPENADSGNVFITGDNLEALRHLQNAYGGKVKMIYIDPPYNTGKEFVYNDHFEFSDEKLKSALGYDDNEIVRLRSLQGKSSHSAWLTFMYPRLKIAQKLLTDDGVIFVSIDDNEQANLKLLMDDVFGEGNYIEIFSWQKTTTPPNLSDKTKKSVEYILTYKKKEKISLKGLIKDSNSSNGLMNQTNVIGILKFPEYITKTKLPNGLYKKGIYGTKSYMIELLEDAEVINGTFARPVVLRGKFKWTQSYLDQSVKDGVKLYIQTKAFSPSYEKEEYEPEVPWNIINGAFGVGTNENAGDEVDTLFGKNFSEGLYPKPTTLIKYLANMVCYSNDIILDFFAGSATTAHAVMQLNAEDGGNRKFIMVQLDEPTNETSEARRAGYKTIDQISRKRIELAAKKIQSEVGMFADKLDTGFKHYLLQTPDVPTLDKITNFVPDDNLFATDMLTPFANKETETSGVDTILTTWLIDDGCPFDTKVETRKFADYSAHYVPETATLYLINEGWTTASLKELLNEIGQGKLGIQTIVIYPYSFGFTELRELKTNVKTNLENTPNIIERY